MAEREGFEPSIRFCRILTFQASAFDHSATAPHFACRGLLAGWLKQVRNQAIHQIALEGMRPIVRRWVSQGLVVCNYALLWKAGFFDSLPCRFF